MAILNYTTQINVYKTISEITEILVNHGASKIVTDYEGKNPKAITFCVPMRDSIVFFALPANYKGVLNSMKKFQGLPKKFLTEEQAIRVSWRIVKDWIEAQMAMVEAELADIAEVFLPYAVTSNGNTLYQEIGSHKFLNLLDK